MSKHTPGPWTYDEDASEILSGSEASGWIWIADVAQSVPSGETQANARLIAAAPRMYARIEALAADGDPEAMAIMEAVSGRS